MSKRAVCRSPILSLALLWLAVACSNSTPAGPVENNPTAGLGADGRATGPSGLEQRLVTAVQPAPAGSPYTAMLVATSTLKNTGTTPVRVKARICLVQEADFESTANLARFEPTISCAGDNMTMDLAPGATIGPIEVQFGVRSGPGRYTLKLRHALEPEFRAQASFEIP